jgi:regulator of RNase E activity RraA
VAVVIRGACVKEGDFVIADSSAVVVCSPANIEEVLQTAESIARQESVMANALRAHESISTVMTANYENMLKSTS